MSRMDSKEHRIVISVTPHYWDNKKEPYFWLITLDGCNCGFGWSETPEKAWEEAFNYYKVWEQAFKYYKEVIE